MLLGQCILNLSRGFPCLNREDSSFTQSNIVLIATGFHKIFFHAFFAENSFAPHKP